MDFSINILWTHSFPLLISSTNIFRVDLDTLKAEFMAGDTGVMMGINGSQPSWEKSMSL